MNQLVPLKLNSEREGLSLARKYQVSSLPTILIVDAAGAVQGTIRGFLPPGEMAQTLTRILADARDLPPLLARLKANPSDLALARTVLVRSLARGSATDALNAANILEKRKPGGLEFAVYGELSQILLRQGKGRDARGFLQKALPKAPSGGAKATCHFLIGLTWYQEKDRARAKQSLQAALNTPGCPDRITQAARQGLADMEKKR